MHIACETAGAARTRSSLRPLISERANEMQNFGQKMPRERGPMSHHVIACNKREAFVQGSEATRQSILQREERPDCFVASLLAMTGRVLNPSPSLPNPPFPLRRKTLYGARRFVVS